MNTDVKTITIPVEEKVFVLSKIYQSIPIYFAHWQDSLFQKDELDSVYLEMVQRGLQCKTRFEFSLLMTEFLAKLNNGHTLFNDSMITDQLPPLGLDIQYIENKWKVTDTSLPGLREGDVVTGVEGKSIDQWYDYLQKYMVGSEHARTVLLSRLLSLFVPDRYTITYENREGDVRYLTIDRLSLKNRPSQPQTEGKWLAKHDIAYVKLPSCSDPVFENEAVEYVNQFKKAACIIIDVRGNSGGNSPVSLIASLMDRPYRWWTESSPLNVGLFSFLAKEGYSSEFYNDSNMLWRSAPEKPDETAYKGRVIILTDRITMSSAEDFVLPFKDNGRALIIGEPTRGFTGQPFRHTFENGMCFFVGTKRAYMPNGENFEGVGIQPDIVIAPNREDIYEGRDRVLEKAVEVATSEF